ncbi:MAG: hypothetical protein Q9187_005889 [Circinaria calcarea]
MRFEETLKKSIYQPWKLNYIDYVKLKRLLRDDDNAADDGSRGKLGNRNKIWTEADEGAFVEELVNVQLEKVNAFQADTYSALRERTSKFEARLEPLVAQGNEPAGSIDTAVKENKEKELNDILGELDDISREISELEKYSRINYTGFLKAAKKHDRKRGSNYKVRPLLQVRLAALPFNAEDYSPLLYRLDNLVLRLSAMYSFVRQNLNGHTDRTQSFSDSKPGGDEYKSHKCWKLPVHAIFGANHCGLVWVHPENLLEVKTYILRRLPVLLYNPQTSKVVEGHQDDPTITSLYFDNSNFSLYNRKVNKAAPASSIRLRWFGHLEDKTEILLEKKTLKDDESSEEIRFPIKKKYINSFLKGDYQMGKSLKKLRDRQGDNGEEVKRFQTNIEELSSFIREHELQPVLRANYTRTAFQIPGDNGVRISIDTNLALIREDSWNVDQPCRNPDEWHRSDIDCANMEFPFTSLAKGEIARFPYALLEIKVRDGVRKRTNEWVDELMSSHLLKEAPRFSKFVHGIAQLFEDYVNSFPFWLSYLETDIRKDPGEAFQEEQEKKARRAEDDLAVGSFLGSKSASSFKAAVGSPAGKQASFMIAPNGRRSDISLESSSKPKPGVDKVVEEEDSDDDDPQANSLQSGTSHGLRSLFPLFSTSKYARARLASKNVLPPGVREPGQPSKDLDPIRVEPKVWLANQRTFVKWCHISVLLASLSLGLYNAAGESNPVARGLAIAYTLIAVSAGVWGWWIFIVRSRMIEQRSGKDFDNAAGPVVICISLIVALCLNFGFKVGRSLCSRYSHIDA